MKFKPLAVCRIQHECYYLTPQCHHDFEDFLACKACKKTHQKNCGECAWCTE